MHFCHFKGVLAELNVKYFNKSPSHKIQASTCIFNNYILGKEVKMKSCGNFPSFILLVLQEASLSTHRNTALFYSLSSSNACSRTLGPMRSFCQPQCCPIQFSPPPDPGDVTRFKAFCKIEKTYSKPVLSAFESRSSTSPKYIHKLITYNSQALFIWIENEELRKKRTQALN